jgi:hypothetical protein
MLDALADSFASEILRIIRSASLEDLLGPASGMPRGARQKGAGAGPAGSRKTGRLPRRSAADIGRALDQVVALVKKQKAGMRAEQIRVALKMQSKEMPRVLKEGVAKKKLKSKGQKRATTYFAV